MRISVFGLGYVGCVTAGCLAQSGHDVWGVDVNPDKVDMINSGASPIVEARINDLLRQAIHAGTLRATLDGLEAVAASELSLVCVGTPGNGDGSLDLRAVIAASQQIGAALKTKTVAHCVVFRSTVLPGSVRSVLIPVLEEAAGKQAHADFDVCVHPEFLREGSSVNDFYDPPFIVIGQHRAEGGDSVARLYEGTRAQVARTTYEVAEMLKYGCNAFHALKVTFANEIGALCKRLGIDSHQVMELFILDRKLNVSPAYLKPGFAFGGPCLPKDLRALLYRAKEVDVRLPVLSSVLPSNHLHLERVVQRILATGRKRIGVLGLSFKPGTDDLRDSPIVALIEELLARGCEVKIHDPDVLLSRIFGENQRYIEKKIPGLSFLMSPDIAGVVKASDVIVIAKATAEIRSALAALGRRKLSFDLVRINSLDAAGESHSEGICW